MALGKCSSEIKEYLNGFFLFPQWGLQVKEEKYAHRQTSFFWWCNTITPRPSEAKGSWKLLRLQLAQKDNYPFSIYFWFKQQ